MSGRFPPLETLVPPHIRDIEPYIPSKPDDVLAKMFGCQMIYRLNNNENALGPSPQALAALRSLDPRQAAVYPSGDAYHLRHKLAERYGHPSDAFLVGNGANELIAFVIKAFCHEGDNIVTADRTFTVYEWVAGFSGFEARLVPLADYGFDDEAMLAAVDDRTKIIFVCNPNNPTGTYWDERRLRRFLDRVAGRQIVVLDEAYGEFVSAGDFPDGMSLINEYPNLVVFRTFSKMFALAALRIGYLAGDERVVEVIRRTCVVYSVNSIAQAAAIGALADADDQIARTRRMVNEARAFLRGELARLGLVHFGDQANYMVVRLPVSDTLAYRKLMRQGIMVRTMTGFRFPNHIRVTLGPIPVMEKFIAALEPVVAG
ncbi:histidinol-phosphate transaminase [Anaeroselena agilis]|uniref:Histidinol-phosphate aminotransferase n=1 Tax=Anaeroselena agilis TaxID=3063788 RepID=A0ABU3P3M0_9FIRM|nr:histidinol-phosphate transaminase [Selenomonadales bacterium 4137-cl]